MEFDLITLFVIVAASFLCPVLSALIPNKLFPETVFLLVFGMVLGPNVLGIAKADEAIELLSNLGLGFLFLLAGYEIDPKKLLGKTGRHGLLTWVVTFAITIAFALAVSFIVPSDERDPFEFLAIAIAMTTTAFGTVVPILQERGIMGTKIGDVILEYGTWGEICPIVAIALLLTTRNTIVTILFLSAFIVIAVVVALIPKRLWAEGRRITTFVSKNADTNAQMTVRAVMLLLVGLLTLSALFELDLVLGAFGAGFILRFVIPKGDELLERKLNGIGFGFFIPLFFIVSGMSIDPKAVGDAPGLLVAFILALLLVRALPIFASLRIHADTRELGVHNDVAVAFYCTTALPLIVAITSITTSTGHMSQDIASLLIAAGGVTVFIMPLLASLAFKAAAMQAKASELKGAVKADADASSGQSEEDE